MKLKNLKKSLLLRVCVNVCFENVSEMKRISLGRLGIFSWIFCCSSNIWSKMFWNSRVWNLTHLIMRKIKIGISSISLAIYLRAEPHQRTINAYHFSTSWHAVNWDMHWRYHLRNEVDWWHHQHDHVNVSENGFESRN